jgi:hypothetical protein
MIHSFDLSLCPMWLFALWVIATPEVIILKAEGAISAILLHLFLHYFKLA